MLVEQYRSQGLNGCNKWNVQQEFLYLVYDSSMRDQVYCAHYDKYNRLRIRILNETKFMSKLSHGYSTVENSLSFIAYIIYSE